MAILGQPTLESIPLSAEDDLAQAAALLKVLGDANRLRTWTTCSTPGAFRIGFYAGRKANAETSPQTV